MDLKRAWALFSLTKIKSKKFKIKVCRQNPTQTLIEKKSTTLKRL